MRMSKPVERLRPDQLVKVLRAAEPALMRIALRLCATFDDARDLVDEVCDRASRRGIPADVANPRAHLAKLAKSVFIDRCRAAARGPMHAACDDGTHAEEPVWTNVTSEDLARAARRLEPIDRRTWDARTAEQLSYDQIAQLDGATRTQVAERLDRCRTTLRDELRGKP